MSGSVSVRYALRSLGRNLRRTSLSVVGVAIGVAIGLLAIAWIRGEETMVINSAAGGGVGHLRAAPRGWNERRDVELRLHDWEGTLDRVRATEGVVAASPRAIVGGLLGLGTRSAHVQLTGVDPTTEPRVLRYVRTIPEGRYLDADARGEIVIGRTIASRLGAELEDELVVTSVDANGEMQSALLTVVGIAQTGSREIDAIIAHVPLADVEQLSGREGASEITLLIDDPKAIAAMRPILASEVSEEDEVLTWLDVSPELRNSLEGDGAFMSMAVVIILIVVLLGVASAQLTGVLERRKEFAVLRALGMRGVALVRVVVTEGLALGFTSGLAALALAAPFIFYLSTTGVDLSKMMESEDDGWALGGVLFDPMFYPDFGLWLVPAAFGLSMIATLVASFYPAWFASKTDPATALRVDR